ncbi:MAG: hypothetical protein PHC61_06310, partial [Chitinivibrionales bacterium]|nr:hypothetical protein [Chitinivibrionales bacterium]
IYEDKLVYLQHDLTCKKCLSPEFSTQINGYILGTKSQEFFRLADSLFSTNNDFMEIENWECALSSLQLLPPCEYENALENFLHNPYNKQTCSGMCDKFVFKLNAWINAKLEPASYHQVCGILHAVKEDSLSAIINDKKSNFSFYKLRCQTSRWFNINIISRTSSPDSVQVKLLMIRHNDDMAPFIEHTENLIISNKTLADIKQYLNVIPDFQRRYMCK